MKSIFISLFFFVSFKIVAQSVPSYTEPFRPRFHFSAAKNWINDPNGLVYYNGEYHLFYQHNPFANVWGHMTWGHAVSKDLLHWKHLPIAIPEDSGIMIFSGTCVADTKNSSGFAKKAGQIPMVAIYTGHVENVNQSQYLAYSLDNGRTWTKYSHNPVLDLHKKDFRDPKVFWYAPKNYWVMSVMLPVEHMVQFYSSKNLKQWNHLSDFGPAGDTSGVWECPDLSQVPVDGSPSKKKWLLMMSQNASMQYFVGGFDGIKFINENPSAKIFRPDYGPDYYAAISYNQLPVGKAPVSIGWLNNWNYANDLPTTPWKGAMSIPRTLSLKKNNDQWVLLQNPVPGIKTLRGDPLIETGNESINETKQLPVKSSQFELELVLNVADSGRSGIRIAAGNNHALEIGYDKTKQLLYLDRSKTPNQSFSKSFEERNHFETFLSINNNLLHLHLFFDHSIAEVFAENGIVAITAQVFPADEEAGIELFSDKPGSRLISLSLFELRSAW